ncbi:hypothetical protein LDO26_01395 [Luteimonas sp. BDR2-5]|uniref:hypothetical protein n=1 Tax=Proluteimonas luteida TaxID=2878685 RepID=UPI001E646362|nr:hypothetical protein [Luteimonas sp. BDR2-5]MCD9026869.1 hypothetical protein [Luteimonas sp. BDR2-5]
MTAPKALLAAFVFALALAAQAHRLDEYLQAATVAVASDRVALHLRLTPGVEVADAVIAGIDRDGNGVLSQAEWADYAAGVQADLHLEADGAPLPLRLTGARFADATRMRQGEATILLDFEADLPRADGPRSLVFENRHRRDIAVHLVNALAPRDPAVRILGQRRSPDQSSWRLDFVLESPGI